MASWYDSITEDLGHLKELVSDLGETVMDTVIGEDAGIDRKVVDDSIQHLSTRAAPRQWADAAADSIKTTKDWLDCSASSPEFAEITATHAALIEGHATFKAMRDWHKIIDRLWDLEDACIPRDDDSLEQLRARRNNVDTLKNRLEKRWEDSIEDRKIIVAFRPRIQNPTGAFEGLFDQMNRNQKSIAETLANINGFREKIDAAIPAAEEAEVQQARDNESRQQEEADFGEMDDVHKCATDGALSDLSQELSGLVFTTWFEKNAARFYQSGKQGAKIQIPLSEFDCGDGGWNGFQRDAAIKGTGSVTTLDRAYGPMAAPESEGCVMIQFKFTSYFTCKSPKFKMGVVFGFEREMAFFYNEAGFEEGIPQDVSGFSRTGGDDQPQPR